MRRRLVASYLVLVAVALVLFTVPVAASSASLLRQTLEETAEREARLFVPLTLRTDAAAATAVTDRTRDFRQATGSVVRLVQAADRDRADARVQAAFAGRTTSPRWGAAADLDPDVPGRRAVSVVVPAVQDGRVVAVVQVVAPADDVERRIRDIWVFRLGVGGAVLVLAGGLAVLLAGTLVRPLRRLEAVAARHGRGDLRARAPVGGPPEIATLARTLNDGAARTSALLDSQRAFTADASHQLQTPLTALRLQVDNLRESVRDSASDPSLVETLEEGFDGVDAELARMSGLVGSLLTLARAESGATAPVGVDLAAVVRGRVASWRAAADDAGLLLHVDRPDALPGPVAATPGTVEQVLDNVLDNAVSVSPRGSRITLSARRRDGDVELRVDDEGPGLPAPERARAFDRFWQAPGRRHGSGLGLAVVRRLVEHDGGSVDLTTAPGGGLSVVLRWPGAGAGAGRPEG